MPKGSIKAMVGIPGIRKGESYEALAITPGISKKKMMVYLIEDSETGEAGIQRGLHEEHYSPARYSLVFARTNPRDSGRFR